MFKELMQKIIDKKYEELNYDKRNKNNIFWKITEFEANAIGQIGEGFVKEVFRKFNVKFDDTKKHIHDEYDILLDDGTKIEIKTARKGKRDIFQFNAINPKYNFDYIICVAILEDDLLYRIIGKNKIQYVHKERRWFVDLEETNEKRKLVSMNVDSQEIFKLVLNKKYLKDISDMGNELKSILEKQPSKSKL